MRAIAFPVAAAVSAAPFGGFAGNTPAAEGTLESNARSGFVKSLYSLAIDQVNGPE